MFILNQSLSQREILQRELLPSEALPSPLSHAPSERDLKDPETYSFKKRKELSDYHIVQAYDANQVLQANSVRTFYILSKKLTIKERTTFQ